MRQQSGSLTYKILCPAIIFLFIFNIFLRFANASGCVDIKIIFARGSSDNPEALYVNQPYGDDFKSLEAIPGSFFQGFKRLLDRDYPSVRYDSVSVHNFPDLYNSDGYRAVGIFGPKTINNIFEAEVSWWPAGEYRESVKGGVEEVAGYVKDQIKDCPNEMIVLGGYSQGANVIGDSLFEFTDEEQEHIHAVALFGDPKYIGSNATQSTPIDYLSNNRSKPIAKPWKRGTASLVDRGYLDARIPYLPIRLENRTLSWCFNDDFVCAGGSGVLKSMRPLVAQQDNNLNKDDLGAGHKRYVGYGAPEAAEEIVQRLSPKLSNLEASRGGKNVLKSFSENTPVSPSDMPMDVMFMINTSYGIDDVLGRLRSDTITLLPPYLAFYNNVNYGIGEYSEAGETTNRIPRVSIRQQPTLNFDTLDRAISRKLSYGGLSGGGLDLEDPHQLGIERAIRATNWREGAEKHVVIISERPLLGSITYNMCNSSVRTNFGIEESVNCLVDPSIDTGSSFSHPERCKYIYEMLTSGTCMLNMSPGSTYAVQRNENSLIELMEASDVTVSFVVPHGFKSGANAESSRTKLKSLASVSGGLYLEYSEFNRASYSDVVWKVLNNRPTRIKLKNIQDFNSANSVYSESKDNPSLRLFTDSTQLFTVIGSGIYDTYSWDINGDGIVDETTDAPQIELKYSSALENKYLAATASSSTQSSTIRVPINVVDAGSSAELNFPNSPDVTAQENPDGSVKVVWTCGSAGVLFIDLDRDGAVDYSAPCSVSEGLFNDVTSEYINVWNENYSGKSDIITVKIDRYVSPIDPGGGGASGPGEDFEADDSSGIPGGPGGEDSEEQESSSENGDNGQNIDQSREEDYSKNLSDITKEVVRMLHQTQVRQGGNNTNTYNPQRTQAIDQGAAKNEQKAAAFNQETLTSEFYTTTRISVFSSTDALAYIAVLVMLPMLIIYYRIYIRFKK